MTLCSRSSPGLFTIFTQMHYWLLAFGLSFIPATNGPDPQKHFGESYTAAVRMYRTLQPQIRTEALKNNLSPELMAAVIFPELIRYDRFRDLLETTALENIYVRFGKDKADFSIGPFQMKPSFIETLEQRIAENPEYRHTFRPLISYPDPKPTSVRSMRIQRLGDSAWQCAYLAAFMVIAQHDYNTVAEKNDQARLLLLATAYNRGLGTPRTELEQLARRKTFPYGHNMPTGFSYYDVAQHFHETLNSK